MANTKLIIRKAHSEQQGAKIKHILRYIVISRGAHDYTHIESSASSWKTKLWANRAIQRHGLAEHGYHAVKVQA